MKTLLLSLFVVAFLLAGCSSKDSTTPAQPVVLPGGKGGTHHIAVFTKHDGKGVPGRIFLKYGATAAPAFNDTSAYDEAFNTMTEPGYGPHAHFDLLKEGYYYVYAICSSTAGTVKGGRSLQIKKDDPAASDMDLVVK